MSNSSGGRPAEPPLRKALDEPRRLPSKPNQPCALGAELTCGAYHNTTGKAAEAPNKDAAAWAKDMLQDIAALSDHASYLSNKTNFLLDATLGLINLEQNQIIKIFSIAAVCLMPPTLVASSYGINFRSMPELDWLLGYPWALSLMLITAIIPFVWFKRKGWL